MWYENVEYIIFLTVLDSENRIQWSDNVIIKTTATKPMVVLFLGEFVESGHGYFTWKILYLDRIYYFLPGNININVLC